MASGKTAKSALITVRRSKVHGSGVFAARPIRKGTRIIEYTGERVTHAQADSRYEDKDESDNHTFLFIVDRKIVIDAGIDGNDARFINHSCDPNCANIDEIFACRCGSEACRGTMLWPAKRAPRKKKRPSAVRADAATKNRTRSVSAER